MAKNSCLIAEAVVDTQYETSWSFMLDLLESVWEAGLMLHDLSDGSSLLIAGGWGCRGGKGNGSSPRTRGNGRSPANAPASA